MVPLINKELLNYIRVLEVAAIRYKFLHIPD